MVAKLHNRALPKHSFPKLHNQPQKQPQQLEINYLLRQLAELHSNLERKITHSYLNNLRKWIKAETLIEWELLRSSTS